MAALFTAFKINGWGPAVTHRWHFLWEKKKKNAEPVTRTNALAWRQPFCTTSGGTDRHREALALSWHRPDPGLGVVTDSQAGACQAWRLSLLTSVHAISLSSSVAGPRTLTLGSLSLLLHFAQTSLPLLLCPHLALLPCVVLRLSFTLLDLALWSDMTCKLMFKHWRAPCLIWIPVSMQRWCSQCLYCNCILCDKSGQFSLLTFYYRIDLCCFLNASSENMITKMLCKYE